MCLLSLLFSTWVIIALNSYPAKGQEFETTHGRIRGKTITVKGKPVDVFLGIPFAKPPVGDLRFKHPKTADSWRPRILNATKETPSCIQSALLFAAIPLDQSLSTPNDFSEDCLHLNIWKLASSIQVSNLAVMVWIYGGGFSVGSTRVPVYNGKYLTAENDVIVVTLNYRVGPLGFSFLGPDTIPGNMGLMDQVEAIRWVKNNIENFGGDKNKITLFGQSAGASSVGLHLLSPLATDLFNNAILQSGAPIHRVQNSLVLTAAEARNNAKTLSEALECSGSSEVDIFSCLKMADSHTINDGFNSVSLLGVTFYPVVDGYFLPSDPMTIIKRKEHKKTNILTGVTKDEITLFYYTFLNPFNRTFLLTGESFNSQHFKMVVPSLTGLTDTGRLKALITFYESEHSPPLDYLQVLDQLGSDFTMKCGALLFSALYSDSNNVYLYSLNHRLTTMRHPEWMGVPHGYDVEFVFGSPLDGSHGSTQEDMHLSKKIMTYWTNFAKYGNPNTISSDTPNWPVFSRENQSYLSLDVGSNLATRHGFRRHQCAFVSDILPMIPKDTDVAKPVTTSSPGCRYPISGGRRQCPGCVYVILSLLTGFFWVHDEY